MISARSPFWILDRWCILWHTRLKSVVLGFSARRGQNNIDAYIVNGMYSFFSVEQECLWDAEKASEIRRLIL